MAGVFEDSSPSSGSPKGLDSTTHPSVPVKEMSNRDKQKKELVLVCVHVCVCWEQMKVSNEPPSSSVEH